MPVQAYYDCHKGIQVLPGMWRPHHPWEPIAWIHPAWGAQDYVWLDFPENIDGDQGMFFHSHVYPDPVLKDLKYPDLPRVPWKPIDGGLQYERTLPNGLRFGGSVRRGDEQSVELRLHMHNGADTTLTNMRMVTCLMLRMFQGFEQCTSSNKFVYLADRGWTSLFSAQDVTDCPGRFPVGGPRSGVSSPLPVVVAQCADAPRLIAMTWFDDTHTLSGNSVQPCMHADACVGDLAPGSEKRMGGRILFIEGSLDDVRKLFEDRYAV